MSEGLLTVNVGGLEFFGHRGPFAILKDGLTGWGDGVDRVRDSQQRVRGHGSYPAEVFLAQRLIDIKAMACASSVQQLNGLRTQFLNLTGHQELVKVSVERKGQLRWTRAQVTGKPTFVEQGGLPRASVSLQLTSDDPYLYGEPHQPSVTVGDSVALFQRGTAEAWPVLTVTGSMPGGYELTLAGRLVEVTKALASGDTHTIDMRTGILRENGGRVMRAFGVAEYFSVKPGADQNFWSTPRTTGTGTIRIDYNDTYT